MKCLFRVLFLVTFFSSTVFGASSTITLNIEAGSNASLLLLPIPDQAVSINSNIDIRYNNQAINAEYSVVTLWPHIDSPLYVRTLLIDSAELKNFSGKLTFHWSSNHTDISKTNLNIINEALRQDLRLKLRNTLLVYPNKQWLRQSILQHPMRQYYSTDWYVLPQQKYAHFITDTEALRSKGYPPNKAGQWLYDRPQSIYQLFVMTEDQYWLNKADILTDFYKNHIDDNGQFDLIKRFDPKYLMPRGLALQFLLKADYSALEALKKIFNYSLEWDEKYVLSRGFWTERNQSTALNTAVTYWELTGDLEAFKRINEIIDATVEMTFNPVNDWPLRGCPQHSFKAHEGWGDNSPACSPWMMALLGDSLWRYYRLTGDERAEALIDAFGDFILNHGLYYGNKRMKNIVIPKYIVSIENPKQEELNQWTDPQHACDVAALLGKSVYVKQIKRRDDFLIKELFSSLIEQCKQPYRKLKAEKKLTKYWTLKPARRFAWMYSSTSDLPWLVDKLLKK